MFRFRAANCSKVREPCEQDPLNQKLPSHPSRRSVNSRRQHECAMVAAKNWIRTCMIIRIPRKVSAEVVKRFSFYPFQLRFLKNKNCGIYKVEVTLSQSRLLMGRQVKQRRSRQNRKNPISPINDALSNESLKSNASILNKVIKAL